MSRSFTLFLFYFIALLNYSQAQGLAVHGEARLQGEQTPLYVNLDAPKSGRLVTGVLGSFDTVNPFNLKGVAGPEIRHFTVESLMKRHMDEPFTLYPLLAEKYILSDDRNSLRVTLNKNARFYDDTPVTSKDVFATFTLLKEQGRPNYRTYYSKVKSFEIIDDLTFILSFDAKDDRELPLILGLMPIFKAAQFEGDRFSETTQIPVIASGPYKITDVKFGERLTLQLNKNWWAKDLPLNKGQHNFEELRFDFYRDQTALLEAFKKGLVDWRLETDPIRWRELKKENLDFHEIKTEVPYPYRAYFFNTRRGALANIDIRKAMHLIFDAEAMNKNLYDNAFVRTLTPFQGSELATVTPIIKPVTREVLREALNLFKNSGYELKNGLLTNTSGELLKFEILVNNRDKERLAKALAAQFLKVGLTLDIRLLDNVQYEFRLKTYDFDIIDFTNTNSLSPGNEQGFYWSSKSAMTDGTRNYAGLQSAAVDHAIADLTRATSREEIVKAAKRLDQAIYDSYVTLPLFQPTFQYIALNKGIKMPIKQSKHGYLPETWWRE